MMQLEEKDAMPETLKDCFTALSRDVKEAMDRKALFPITFV